MSLRTGLWSLIAALVVLATRAVVYALAPSQGVLLEELAHREGGPRLAGVLTAAVLIAVLVAAAVALARRRRGARAARARTARGRGGAAAAARAARCPRGAALRRQLVRVRDARVVPALAGRARLARAALPARAGAPGRDPDPGRADARRRRRPRRDRAPGGLGTQARRATRCPRAAAPQLGPRAPCRHFPRSRFTGSAVLPRGPPDGVVPVLSS